MRAYSKIQQKAILLRRGGKTYSEIQRILKIKIPKSTLSTWCHQYSLSQEHQQRIDKIVNLNLKKAREIGLLVHVKKRKLYFAEIEYRNRGLLASLRNKKVAKLALAVLYVAEGSKRNIGSLTFGNSDPGIIKLFFQLLRYCYSIDETKFRCTLQCRADQDTEKLEEFWSRVTRIPRKQFYHARVDPRTVGKPSRKIDYKGVCRVNYFSAEIFHELSIIGKMITS